MEKEDPKEEGRPERRQDQGRGLGNRAENNSSNRGEGREDHMTANRGLYRRRERGIRGRVRKALMQGMRI